jgi:hypothetical protein
VSAHYLAERGNSSWPAGRWVGRQGEDDMTAHEATTCSARRRAAEIAASAGVRSAPCPACPACHGWCGDHSAPAHALALPRHRLAPFSLPTTHCSLLTARASPHLSHLARTRLVSGPQGCNLGWRNTCLPGSPCGPRSLACDQLTAVCAARACHFVTLFLLYLHYTKHRLTRSSRPH